MNRIFLFNPENDIALGLGAGRFTPPRQAALLHTAGAMLPFWLGDGGDFIIVDKDSLDDCVGWRLRMGIDGPVPVVSSDDIIAALRSRGCTVQSLELAPWGWSMDALAQFARFGIDNSLMERFSQRMERHRELSHRRSGLALLRLLRDRLGGDRLPAVMPAEVFDFQSVKEFVLKNGQAMVKSPWSSSGRGVFPVTSATIDKSADRIGGIINRQGSVMVEPLLERVIDFAMLFDYAHDAVSFSGYSLFVNSTATNYGGNLVAPDEEIVRRLARYVDEAEIECVKASVADLLPEIFGYDYEGPIGVDMMIYRGIGGKCRIAPCIEINLRTTMGFVARGIYSKLGRVGMMTVSPVGVDGHLRDKVAVDGVWTPGRTGGQETEAVMLAPGNRWFDFIFSTQV